jgi:hypothetical protein
LLRDKVPIKNLGYGVTSRDVPAAEGEQQRPSSSSGAIGNFLHDKPIIKYLSSTAATLLASYVASKGLSKGGLKLASTIQKAADSGSHLGSRVVRTANQIRKTLDELEGLNRFIEDGVDPYAKLIHTKSDGSIAKPLLSKLAGPGYVSDGTKWMTAKEFRAAATGAEPAAIWSYRDQLQQNLVKGARTLAIGLPSTYIVQRGVTGPLFGNDEDRPKTKWYNPVDVLTDFVKQSTLNITNIVLPNAAAGAGVSRLKSLADARYMDFPLPLTKNQLKTSNKIADIKTILNSFGQDAGQLMNQATRISASATHAFNVSWQDSQTKESGFVFSLHQARKGYSASRVASELSGEGKLKSAAKSAKSYLFGYHGLVDTDLGPSMEDLQGFADTIPAIRNVPSTSRSFLREFKRGKNAYDVISGAISFDEGLRKASGDPNKASEILNKTIAGIRQQHSSRFINLVGSSYAARSIANPDGTLAKKGSWISNFEQNAYNRTLEEQMVSKGYNRSAAQEFISGLKVKRLPGVNDTSLRNISQRITYGVNKNIAKDDDEFFNALVQRAKKDLGKKGQNFTEDSLKQAFATTDRIFSGEDFRTQLQQRANISFTRDAQDIFASQAAAILRPQKAVFGDFTGTISATKQQFLSRKVAESLRNKTS